MACFVVPAAEAIVTTITAAIIRKKEKKQGKTESDSVGTVGSDRPKVGFSRKLSWLNVMLWGGSALLMFEHIWHGEVVPFFPFLTAAANPADAAGMLHEMATAGVLMAVVVTAVWLGIVGVTSIIEKRAEKEAPVSGAAANETVPEA